jgi:cytochrome c oxidase cbb3-type subunit IV
MDINLLRIVATVTAFIMFIVILGWAFSPSKKKQFDEAAGLPFANEKEPDQ